MKRVLISVAAIVVLIGAFFTYSYFTPVINISIGKPVDPNAESYTQHVMIGGSTKYNLPMPEKTKARMKEFAEATHAVVLELHENYDQRQPMQIKAAVEVTGGQTIVTYSGFITDEKSGKPVLYNKELVFDYVLTKDINH